MKAIQFIFELGVYLGPQGKMYDRYEDCLAAYEASGEKPPYVVHDNFQPIRPLWISPEALADVQSWEPKYEAFAIPVWTLPDKCVVGEPIACYPGPWRDTNGKIYGNYEECYEAIRKTFAEEETRKTKFAKAKTAALERLAVQPKENPFYPRNDYVFMDQPQRMAGHVRNSRRNVLKALTNR